MSAYGKLDIGFDGPFPVLNATKDPDLLGISLSSPDAFCGVVLAVQLIATAGWVAYFFAFEFC